MDGVSRRCLRSPNERNPMGRVLVTEKLAQPAWN